MPQQSPIDLSSLPFPNCVCLYENNGIPSLAVVLKNSVSRVTLITHQGEQLDLPPNRLYVLPTKLPAQAHSKEDKVEFLKNLLSTSSELATQIDLEKLWNKHAKEQKEFATEALTKSYFEDNQPIHHLAMRLALISSTFFFKRSKVGFIPRTLEQISEMREKSLNREQRLLAAEEFSNIIKRRLSENIDIPDHLTEFLHLLEGLAADSQLGDRLKDAREVLDLCLSKVQLQLGQGLNEKAYNLLVKCNLITARTDLAILRHQGPTEFPKDLAAQIESGRLIREVAQQREDLSALVTFTIDDVTTKDMDDALSIEKTEDGYQLGIHISDVAYAIEINSSLDTAAKSRATSIYTPTHTFNMLPCKLAQDELSLGPNLKRPALSLVANISLDYKILDSKFVESWISVSRKYSYDEADEILEKDPPAWEPEGVHSLEAKIHLLHQIALTFEQSRIAAGARRVNKPDANIDVDENGKVSLREFDEAGPARSLVGEMMILINKVSAEFAASNNIPFIFRSQPEPDITRTPNERGAPAIGPSADYQARLGLRRSMTLVDRPMPHSSLGLKAYAQISSPIRRYGDLVNQRQLLAILHNKPVPYKAQDLIRICDEIEEPLGRARNLSRSSRRYWILRYLEQRLLEDPIFNGTILRTDLKNPLVEVAECYSSFFVPLKGRRRIGEVVKLKLQRISSRRDQVQFTEFKGQ